MTTKKKAPKKEKKVVNKEPKIIEGIFRTVNGDYVVKVGERPEEHFVGDELTALNEAIKRYKILLTE